MARLRSGILRGIHYEKEGSSVLVTCVSGSVWNVAVDLRIGSKTFASAIGVELNPCDGVAMHIGPGIGHGYLSLCDDSILVYACSSSVADSQTQRIFPLDDDLGVAWPATRKDGEPITWSVGHRDRAAPSLAAARESGLLPP